MKFHPGEVVFTQPTEDVWNFDNKWSFSLFDCCSSNIKDFALTFCCFPCYSCVLLRRTGESCGTLLILPLALVSLRTKMRTSFRIKGSICNDCVVTTLCPFCAVLQITNELEAQSL